VLLLLNTICIIKTLQYFLVIITNATMVLQRIKTSSVIDNVMNKMYPEWFEQLKTAVKKLEKQRLNYERH